MSKSIIEEFSHSKHHKQESDEFYRWLNSPYDLDQKEDALNDLWNKIEVSANLVTEESYEKTCQKINRTNKLQTIGRIRRNIMKWAAVIIITPLFLAFFGSYIYIDYSKRQTVTWIEVNTKYGEKKTVVLPDSSVIALNSGSKLIYPKEFIRGNRQVFLSGEGYATITQDKNKPFVLSAGDINIEVLGTSFNVKSYTEDSEVEIALVEGSVLVDFHAINKSLKLKPGEALKYDKTTLKATKRSFDELAINSGSLHFINSRFRDIVLQLERNFNVQIVVSDNSLMDERYYAMFVNNENVDQILQSLDILKSFKISRDNNIIYLNKK